MENIDYLLDQNLRIGSRNIVDIDAGVSLIRQSIGHNLHNTNSILESMCRPSYFDHLLRT
jgi:hypothetical protein